MTAPPLSSRSRPRLDAATLGLLLITLSWGFNWPAVKLALNEMPVWSMRAVSLSLGAGLLLALAKLSGRSLHVARGEWGRLVLAGLFNVTGFNLLTAFAQTMMPTSRAAILAYTMPLWTALLARIFLGERLTPRRQLALGLGAAGLAAIVAPLVPSLGLPGVQGGIMAILGAAMSWAIGTIIVKRAPFSADPVATTSWQLVVGAISAWIGFLALEVPHLSEHAFWPATAWGWGGLLYNGVIGVALSYFLWFGIVARLPASTAAIGTLLVPVVGVTSAMAIIGDRPSLYDMIGFVLIVAAVLINLTAQNQPKPEASA